MKKVFLLPVLCMAGSLLAGCGQAQSEWTVTFDHNFDGAPVASTVKVKNGEKVAKPTDPEREGYNFLSWFKEAEAINDFDFEAPITKDTTVFADWFEKPDMSKDIKMVGTINNWDLTNNDYKMVGNADTGLYEIKGVELYEVEHTFQIVTDGAWSGQRGFSFVDTTKSTEGCVDAFGGFEPNLNIRIRNTGVYTITLDPTVTSNAIVVTKTGELTGEHLVYNTVGTWSKTEEVAYDPLAIEARGKSTIIEKNDEEKYVSKAVIEYLENDEFFVQKGFKDDAEKYDFDDIDVVKSKMTAFEEGADGMIKATAKKKASIEIDPTADKKIILTQIDVEYHTVTLTLDCASLGAETAGQINVKGSFDGWTAHAMTKGEGTIYTFTYPQVETGRYEFGFFNSAAGSDEQIQWMGCSELGGANFRIDVENANAELHAKGNFTTEEGNANATLCDGYKYVKIVFNSFENMPEGLVPAVHGAFNGWNAIRHILEAKTTGEGDAAVTTYEAMYLMKTDGDATASEFGVLLLPDATDATAAQVRNSWMGAADGNVKVTLTAETMQTFTYTGVWTVPAEETESITGVATAVVA